MKNYYDILGVDPSAETQDIKKAYFELAKKYHPDSSNEEHLQQFHEITTAYKTLSDADLKKAYDLTLEVGLEMIKAKEAEIVSKNPVYPTVHVKKREAYRDEELREFQHNRFKKAVFRVILFSLIFGALGGFVAMLLAGKWYFGFMAALLMGFSISIRENFDIRTFFESPKKRRLFQGFVWMILGMGVLYFFVLLEGVVVK